MECTQDVSEVVETSGAELISYVLFTLRSLMRLGIDYSGYLKRRRRCGLEGEPAVPAPSGHTAGVA